MVHIISTSSLNGRSAADIVGWWCGQEESKCHENLLLRHRSLLHITLSQTGKGCTETDVSGRQMSRQYKYFGPPPHHHLLLVVFWWTDLVCCLKLLTVRHFCIDNRIAPEKSKKKCYIYRLLLGDAGVFVRLEWKRPSVILLNGRHTAAIKQNENVTHVVLLLRVSRPL